MLLSIALASGSLSSIFSGDLSHRVSQSSVRRLVTPTMSGPSFLPWQTVWQARHLLSKLSLPCAASGSVGVADACRLWCSYQDHFRLACYVRFGTSCS